MGELLALLATVAAEHGISLQAEPAAEPAPSPVRAEPTAAELLAPFGALLDDARRGALPAGPVRLRPWRCVEEPARCVLAAAREVEGIAGTDRRDMLLWRGVLADRLACLQDMAEWRREADARRN